MKPIKYFEQLRLYPGCRYKAGKKSYKSIETALTRSRVSGNEYGQFEIEIINRNVSDTIPDNYPECTIPELMDLAKYAKSRLIVFNKERTEILGEIFELHIKDEDHRTLDFMFDYGLMFGDDKDILYDTIMQSRSLRDNIHGFVCYQSLGPKPYWTSIKDGLFEKKYDPMNSFLMRPIIFEMYHDYDYDIYYSDIEPFTCIKNQDKTFIHFGHEYFVGDKRYDHFDEAVKYTKSSDKPITIIDRCDKTSGMIPEDFDFEKYADRVSRLSKEANIREIVISGDKSTILSETFSLKDPKTGSIRVFSFSY